MKDEQEKPNPELAVATDTTDAEVTPLKTETAAESMPSEAEDNAIPAESEVMEADAKTAPTIEELQKALAAAEQKAQENWDKALRIQAEMENLKRRTQKDLEDAHKFALTGFAKELLPVLDSLLLGLQAATGEHEEVQKFREGSELTIKQFEAALAKFNVVALDPVGEPFNAEHHQAMVMQVVEGAAPNTVVNVFQKGYTLNGRLLRPAMVVVAKAPD